MKIFSYIAALLIFSLGLSQGALATGLPYETYTFSSESDELKSPAAFLPFSIPDLFTWVNDEESPMNLKTPTDMKVHDNKLFILDSELGMVIVLNEDFQIINTIAEYYDNGEPQKFNKPEGLAIAPFGDLYVADTENSRIVRMSQEGDLIKVYESPYVQALQEDYRFFPSKIDVDRAGRMYVVARGINRGLMVIDDNGDFTRFTGSPRVTFDLITLIWKRILPRSAAETMINFVPTEFSNLSIDNDGFIYTTIKSIDTITLHNLIRSGVQQEGKVVQKFNATGSDVLRRYGTVPIVGDLNWDLPTYSSQNVLSPVDITEGASTFEDIIVDKNGYYYCLDSYRGKIFAYDSDGNLLYAFGNKSNQEGTIGMASAIELFSEWLLVLDRANGRLIGYSKTDYGEVIEEAASLFIAGYYQESLEKWQEASKYNGNLTIAHVGIGKSAYRLGDYEMSMKHLKLAGEHEYFSRAFEAIRANIISKYFILIFFTSVLLIMLITLYALGVLDRFKKPAKEYKSPVLNGLKFSTFVIFRPFKGFWELKREKRGNILSATLLLLATVISYLFNQQYSGYLYSTYDPDTYNVFSQILIVILPVLLWVLANWCLTTLMDGEGNMKDVYVATCYSLTPLVLVFVPLTIVSNVMGLSEMAYYYFILNFAFIWVGFLLIIGSMITHQYSVMKTIITGFLTIIGMVIIIFIGILFYNLLQRMLSFVLSSWQELTFRT